MKKRLFFYPILILLLGLSVFFTASVYITRENNFNIAEKSVIEITHILAGLYNRDTEPELFVQSGDNARITVISPDGGVLADSRPLDLNTADNHLDRPEIQAAANGLPAAYVRYSETLGIDLIYYALKAETGGGYVFIRAAVPAEEINAYLYKSLPLLISVLIAVALLCFVFIRGMVNRITRPFTAVESKLRLLSSGGYVSEPAAGSYEEINKIVREIDEIALVLQDSFDSLGNEKTKLDYILNNIGDGIFAVDQNKNVTLINNSALNIFGVTPDISDKNLNYLTSDKILIGAVEDCVKTSNNALFEILINGKIYLVTVKRPPDTKLITAVLSDVTENRENAKRREEFFANASHELKTPLTAIKGFNELTAINNKDDNIKKYIDSITRETDRMLSLIGDMLKLSELENARSINPAPVSLADIVKEVADTMSVAVNEKGISLTFTGDGAITAEQGHIYELVKNLVENAARYNNQGGKVSIIIENCNKTVKLTVSDDGIGISPAEQTRIFERFYRVEKSRSQRGGGTGLGLSIVKHICSLYDWKLSLKSKLGVGTDITVDFNRRIQ
ncbi:MAG: ATP-binding protein [Oscillospiraceae bacterium]|nr:ATP-binding protein [Oscillospiraceae bacterium]